MYECVCSLYRKSQSGYLGSCICMEVVFNDKKVGVKNVRNRNECQYQYHRYVYYIYFENVLLNISGHLFYHGRYLEKG